MIAVIHHIENQEVNYKELVLNCPACKTIHNLPVEVISGYRGPLWTWDGNLDKPTITPSINVTWNTPDGGKVCHSFMRNGMFEFLSDCTHSFAGQSIPAAELLSWMEEP